MSNLTISYYANLAHKILTSSGEGKQYLDNREVIRLLFTSSDWNLNNYKEDKQRQKLKARLTLIDSYYSTNVGSFCFDGIDEIVEGIIAIKTSDTELKKYSKEFIDNISNEHEIWKLLNNKYGWNILNKDGLKATSLISKFIYFLMDYKFPIYDSFVKKYHTRIFKYFKNTDFFTIRLPKSDSELSLFYRLREMNGPIDDFEKLDNLLWLTGKIAKGSFYLILEKERHKELIERSKNYGGRRYSDNIIKYICGEEKDFSDIFSGDLIEFINLVKKITGLCS